MSVKESKFELDVLLNCRADNMKPDRRIALESAIWHVKGALLHKLKKMQLQARMELRPVRYIQFTQKMRELIDRYRLEVDNRITYVRLKPQIDIKQLKKELMK